jgi:pimeloyl-ACP methyl ester carboxylesterase
MTTQRRSTPHLHMRDGGSGSPTLLLLHGLGATGDVWTGVITLLEQQWPGRWMVPDLPGHGRSGRLDRYTYSTMAQAITDALDAREPLCIMGHSLGGVLAMMLATDEFSADVRSVCALSVKPDDWPEEAMSAAAAVAAMPQPSFATKSEAIDHVLTSLGQIDDMTAWPAEARNWWASSVLESGGAWAPAMDQRVYAVGPHRMDELLVRCRADLLLAAGTMDPLCPPEALLSLHHNVALLDGEGHSPHVRDANTIWPLLQHLLDGSRK